MASRPDKQKVIDEIWDDARVRSFLDVEPAPASGNEPVMDPDFYCLWRAYQGMRAGDFRRFLRFFVDAGRNLDAVNEHGETLATFIAPHRHAGEFIDALEAMVPRPRPMPRAAQES
ncbi:MAG: PA4642 family protein [Gammaproteobacteria bacterium]|nr:PA4642 family protein [Gammaproteobacteria bacterium]